MRSDSPRAVPCAETPVQLGATGDGVTGDGVRGDGVTGDGGRPVDDEPTRRRRATRMAVLRGAIVMIGVIVLLAAATLTPMPSIATARAWSDSLGPWFAVAFFAAYAVVPIAPVPRTAFTLAAGVLFPPALAFVGATASSLFAAVVAFSIARRAGRERIQPYLRRPRLATIEHRLAHRGWLAVGALRMIAVCPFSVLNYLAGLSSIRLWPYVVASLVGMTPGNAAVIFLGDALAGTGSRLGILISATLFAVGVVGLILDTRMPVGGESSRRGDASQHTIDK